MIKKALKIFIIRFAFIFYFASCLAGCDAANEPEPGWLDKNLEENLMVLQKEPNNCFAIHQVAAGYQLKYEFRTAIAYFERMLEICPDHYPSRFQLGICYLFEHDTDRAVLEMDRSISDAKANDDLRWANLALDEKKRWLQQFGSGLY